MDKRAPTLPYQPAGIVADKPKYPWHQKWWGRLALVLATVALLSLALAPFYQFYLAWVGLVPCLLLLSGLRTSRGAFLWGWIAGSLYFLTNLWWLVFVTSAGMPALCLFMGLFWGVAACLIHAMGLLNPAGETLRRWLRCPDDCRGVIVVQVLMVAIAWVAMEFGYGNWPFNGMPFLFLGHTQSPLLAMCQTADTLGVAGITFWVAAVNGLIALAILHRRQLAAVYPAMAAVAVLVLATLGYGVFRLSQQATYAGPTVMVIQPNFPQDNKGNKSASPQEMVDYHLIETERALTQTPDVQLVVWSETMMPVLNEQARRALADFNLGDFFSQTVDDVAKLARNNHVAILAGGEYAEFHVAGKSPDTSNRHNSAYLFNADGNLANERYDKIHLVPFGEYIPFRRNFPPLYRFFNWFSPYSYDYSIDPGADNALTAFPISSGKDPPRFVTPICFEDLDGSLIARMFRGNGAKRADFLVNITNDGWFRGGEMAKHFQAALFRSIENRVPTARSVNTGISGFVDSTGHVHGLLAAGTPGVSVERLELDRRYTLYTRWGDLFAEVCSAFIGVVIIARVVQWRLDRRRKDQTS